VRTFSFLDRYCDLRVMAPKCFLFLQFSEKLHDESSDFPVRRRCFAAGVQTEKWTAKSKVW